MLKLVKVETLPISVVDRSQAAAKDYYPTMPMTVKSIQIAPSLYDHVQLAPKIVMTQDRSDLLPKYLD